MNEAGVLASVVEFTLSSGRPTLIKQKCKHAVTSCDERCEGEVWE